jgi:putative ABC transport system permease protein
VFFKKVVERLAAIPGVGASAGATYMPLGGAPSTSFAVEGRGIHSESEAEANTAAFYTVTPNYFGAMKIPLLRGRDFTAHDTGGSPWVAVISQTMARRYWPDSDPLGRHFTITGAAQGERPRAVIGVAGDVRRSRRDREFRPAVYIPHEQQLLHTQGRFVDSMMQMSFVVRAPGDTNQLAAAIRSAVAQVDRNQPVFSIRTEEQFLDLQVQDSRYYMLLLAVFAGVALTLAAVGIYGLMAYVVSQRTHEIGIRMALGATAGSVLRMVVRQGTWLIAGGLALGVAASFGLTRLLQSQLWGVTATDADTFIGVSALLSAIACVACIVPGRRAAKVDPMVALRHE